MKLPPRPHGMSDYDYIYYLLAYNDNKELMIELMAECIANLEYLAERNGGDTQPFKKLKDLCRLRNSKTSG